MKEWNENSASVRSRLAIKADHTTKGREQDDFYATDPKALQMLIDDCTSFTHNAFGKCGMGIANHDLVWEPACGTGNLARVLAQNNLDVLASDLKDRGYGFSGIDFLKSCAPVGVKLIVTNPPPYSMANEFIEHAMQILPEGGGVYIALMNITYLCGQKRYERIYSKGYLCKVYLFKKRIECWRNNDRETYGGKAMVDFAWYVFQKGYKGQPTLFWL